jgi:hypothetical protein
LASKTPCPITPADKEWIEDNFEWLIKVFGYPGSFTKQVLPDKAYFPETFNNKALRVESVVVDVSKLLNLDRAKISFEIEKDIRDSHDTPYEFIDMPFEAELATHEQDGNTHYRLFIANSLLDNPDRLVFNIILNLVTMRLLESKVAFETEEDETHLFIYLASIYFGFGVIIAQNLVSSGMLQLGTWEKKWNYSSMIPPKVVAYAMALFESLMNRPLPDWKPYLPADFTKDFNTAVVFIKETPSGLFDNSEKSAADLMQEANTQYSNNDFEGAITTLQKASFLTTDVLLKADISNYIGYNYLRLQQFEKSIPHFQKAIELDSGYGYANDNLGFAFIMLGDLLSGKHYLDIAMQTENNIEAYSYRNLALYHQKRGDGRLAEDYFQKAITASAEVDLLEYFYAIFLLEHGKKEEGMACLQAAVDKQEPEAILLMNKLTQNDNTQL